jgi:hypothetical protein
LGVSEVYPEFELGDKIETLNYAKLVKIERLDGIPRTVKDCEKKKTIM